MPTLSHDRVLPAPRVTARGVAMAAGGWSLYALVYSLAVTAIAGVPFVYAAFSQGMYAVLLALASVPVWWIIVRGLFGQPGWRVLLAHGAGLTAYVAVTTGLFLAWTRLGGEAAFEAVLSRAGWIAIGGAAAYATQFAIYHAVEASRQRAFRERQAEAVERLAREQELRTLRAQLNPHFLFNALNTISAQVGRDPHAARETIGRLADLMRYALDAGHRDLVSLRDEIAFVHAYLDLESARMGDRLGAHVEADEATLDALVPPMAIQTLVENAVRHGISPLPEGGTVTVRIHPDGDRAVVDIEDTGAGLGAAAPGTGIGLANTDERLRLLFGPEATLHVDRQRVEGWRVSFSVPASPSAVEVPVKA
ncbi:MAG: histidine kinase [Bacteroidota bacterium]